jgi:inosine-uridine nucleoside N-ribohydrolase
MAVRCVLDCDPGHDDAIAMLLAGSSRELDLRAITTVAGNGSLARTTLNARRVARLARLKVPIAAGAAKPLVGELVTAENVHGESGLDGPELPDPVTPLDQRGASDLILDVLRDSTEQTTLMATGPLTNIARVLKDGQDLIGQIREIVLMGGSTGRGNVTPAAEFNMYVDPEAAYFVFQSGVPIRMCGLNLTHQAIATPDIRERIAAIETELARIVSGWLEYLARTYQAVYGFRGPPVHDACVVAWTAYPDIVKSGEYFVAVELDGKWTRGATVVDLKHVVGRSPNAIVGLELDTERFWELIIDACRHNPADQAPRTPL